MSKILGIDTSNYTTSCAVFDSETMEIVQCKKLLPVKSGEVGLRQSDAVFNHIKQLPDVIGELREYCKNIEGVGVSIKPRWVDGSYMPCFLVGETVAEAISAVSGCEIYKTSQMNQQKVICKVYTTDTKRQEKKLLTYLTCILILLLKAIQTRLKKKHTSNLKIF